MNDKRLIINILGVNVDNIDKNSAVDFIVNLVKSNKKGYIVTPNPEIIVATQKDSELKEILNKANLAIPDGIGLILANNRLKNRVTGVDLLESLCKKASEDGFTVGFLGGRGDAAKKASEELKKKYPNLKVAFALSNDPDEAAEEIKRQPLNLSTSIDLLFVAYGVPKQEKWIAANFSNVPAKVFIGVGGAFDVLSGKLPRAPQVMRQAGLEWLWRLILQPWRIRRQVALLTFVLLIFKQRLVEILNTKH
ncbi:MAG TPA: WecB/TagA/CpsF family glycosyltransferase [Patescibacteria group bacterium]